MRHPSLARAAGGLSEARTPTLPKLAEVFAVSLWAYAVMSNHLHVVVQVLPDAAVQWADEEVAQRWTRLFPKADQDADVRAQALLANLERLMVLRSRLSDLSWFMRCLSEPVARRANAEDHCKGRFWGRFLLLQNLHAADPCA